MSAHTQGPWRVDPDHPCDVQTDDGTLEIACVDPLVLVRGNKPNSADEVHANARLIAAAPELLSSLSEKVDDAEQACFEEWLESNSPSGDHEEVQRKWRQSSDYKDFYVEWDEQIHAIEKATGVP